MYRSLRLALALAAVALVTACAPSPTVQTAAADARNSAYALKSAYGAALTIAVAYAERPSCTPANHPVLCSDDTVVRTMASVQKSASSAINAYEQLAMSVNPDTGTLQTLLQAATAAVTAFKQITAGK